MSGRACSQWTVKVCMNGARGDTGLNRDVSGGRRPQVDSAGLLPRRVFLTVDIPSRTGARILVAGGDPNRRSSFLQRRLPKLPRVRKSAKVVGVWSNGRRSRGGWGRTEGIVRKVGVPRLDGKGKWQITRKTGIRRRVRPSSRGQGGVEASSFLSFPIPSATLLVASRAGDDKPKPAISSCCCLPSSFLTSHSRLPYSFLKKLRETRSSKRRKETFTLLLARASDGAGFFSRFWLEETREGGGESTTLSAGMSASYLDVRRQGKAREILHRSGATSPPFPRSLFSSLSSLLLC